MLRISVEPSFENISLFRNRGARILSALVARADALMIQLQSYIVTQKLSGQVLRRVTGVLASSVTTIPAKVEGTTIVAGVESSGGPAFYGHIFESGGARGYDILPTRARVLRFVSDGQVIFTRMVHREPQPARPFMQPSLDEMKDVIVQGMQEALRRALEG